MGRLPCPICCWWTCVASVLLSISVQWSVTIDPCSAYFQASVGGYLFSIPDIRNQEWRTQVDAQSWCTINQSKLLEITSDSLQSSVVAFINNAISQNLMTGNNVITNGKRYRDSTFAWVNGHPIGKLLFTLLMAIQICINSFPNIISWSLSVINKFECQLLVTYSVCQLFRRFYQQKANVCALI